MEYLILAGVIGVLAIAGSGRIRELLGLKRPVPDVPTLAEIQEQIDAIQDIDELREYAINTGVEPFVAQRLEFDALKEAIRKQFGIS